jgi:hypothetical protein
MVIPLIRRECISAAIEAETAATNPARIPAGRRAEVITIRQCLIHIGAAEHYVDSVSVAIRNMQLK